MFRFKGNYQMKIVCIADHFMKEEFYRDCMAKFPEIELIDVPYFGSHSRNEMRSCMKQDISNSGILATVYHISLTTAQTKQKQTLLCLKCCTLPVHITFHYLW